MALVPDDSEDAESYQPLWRNEDLDVRMTRIHQQALDGEIGTTLYQFGSETTAHGIPRIFTSVSWRGRIFWLLLTVLCGLAFLFQYSLVQEKYSRQEKIVSVELVFDTPSFPAITVCNLNPFKKHLARTVPEISETLDAFHQAVTFSKDSNSYISGRDRRSLKSGFNYVQYEPSGQSDANYCLLKPDRMKRMWEIRGKHIPDKSSPFRGDFLEQLALLGYANMTDEVAITTKTKERLVLTMAGLPRQRRIALSYGKAEFIRMCSFNGQQCDIVSDFKLHVDSAFGNCYTFNAQRGRPLASERAGPSYGLRLMVFVNASDYLPTTEASGIRIAIHDQNEYPFPDTFGYSAPTGFVSSFGISLRKVNRLSKPFGDCVLPDAPLPDSYIYRDYKYEPE
uniref:Uncharacterized protein n=1 Tax=Plectus sambesii TaxID=2011161 RepID=A0A914WRK2_9BILA